MSSVSEEQPSKSVGAVRQASKKIERVLERGFGPNHAALQGHCKKLRLHLYREEAIEDLEDIYCFFVFFFNMKYEEIFNRVL